MGERRTGNAQLPTGRAVVARGVWLEPVGAHGCAPQQDQPCDQSQKRPVAVMGRYREGKNTIGTVGGGLHPKGARR